MTPFFWSFLKERRAGSEENVLYYHFSPQFVILWERTWRCYNPLTPELHSYKPFLLWLLAILHLENLKLVGFDIGFCSKISIIREEILMVISMLSLAPSILFFHPYVRSCKQISSWGEVRVHMPWKTSWRTERSQKAMELKHVFGHDYFN